jgi:hypothetical protein
MAVQQRQLMDVVGCHTFFSRLINIVIFNILCKFLVGADRFLGDALHPASWVISTEWERNTTMLETSIKIVPLQEKVTGTLSDSDTTYVLHCKSTRLQKSISKFWYHGVCIKVVTHFETKSKVAIPRCYRYELGNPHLRLLKSLTCFFLSCKANAGVKLANTGHDPQSSILVVICVVLLLFVLFCCYLCCSMYCLCINVYCTTATRWQPNCS